MALRSLGFRGEGLGFIRYDLGYRGSGLQVREPGSRHTDTALEVPCLLRYGLKTTVKYADVAQVPSNTQEWLECFMILRYGLMIPVDHSSSQVQSPLRILPHIKHRTQE